MTELHKIRYMADAAPDAIFSIIFSIMVIGKNFIKSRQWTSDGIKIKLKISQDLPQTAAPIFFYYAPCPFRTLTILALQNSLFIVALITFAPLITPPLYITLSIHTRLSGNWRTTFQLSPLSSICSLRVNFSKPSFLKMCPRNFSFVFLCISVLFVTILRCLFDTSRNSQHPPLKTHFCCLHFFFSSSGINCRVRKWTTHSNQHIYLCLGRNIYVS